MIDRNVNTWNIKQIEDYERCPYMYKLAHIKMEKGLPDIYSYIEGVVTDGLEIMHSNYLSNGELTGLYNTALDTAEQNGVKFPNDKIGDSWKADMDLFVKDYTKIENRARVGLICSTKINETNVIGDVGDLVFEDFDHKLKLLSWETSSRIPRKEEFDRGRRLILQKLGLEERFGIKVDKVAWHMLRYVCVCYGNRRSIRNRKDWVAKTKNPIVKALKKHGIEDEEEIERLMEVAIKENNLRCLPSEVEEQFKLEECIIDYEVTDYKIEEALDYFSNIINEIVNDIEFNPVDINKDTEFFCNMLCSYRNTCKHIRIHKGLEVSDKEKEIENLFG